MSRRVHTTQTQQICGSNIRDRCKYMFVRILKNHSNMNASAMQWTFFSESQSNSPFTFGWLIGPYGGIFRATNVVCRVCSRCLHKHHGLFLIFAMFVVVCDNRFGVFDVCLCCILAAFKLCTLVWTQLYRQGEMLQRLASKRKCKIFNFTLIYKKLF